MPVQIETIICDRYKYLKSTSRTLLFWAKALCQPAKFRGTGACPPPPQLLRSVGKLEICYVVESLWSSIPAYIRTGILLLFVV